MSIVTKKVTNFTLGKYLLVFTFCIMAFFNGLKRVFGFSNGDYTDEFDDEEYESAAVIQRPIKPQITENATPTKAESPIPNPSTEAKDDTPQQLPEETIDVIANMLNESLPSWASPYIDLGNQRKHIWNVLEPSLRAHIDKAISQALERDKNQIHKIKAEAEEQVKKSQEELKNIQLKSEEIKSQLLSLERQKTAISERTRNLENKVATAEAENEQFRLENKSLLNKLKAVQVKCDDAEFYKSEVERLTNEINSISTNTSNVDKADSSEVEELREKLRIANDEILALQEENAEAAENRSILSRIEQEFEVLEKRLRSAEERASKAETIAAEKTSLLEESQNKISSLNQLIAEKEQTYSLRIKNISQSYEKEIAREREKTLKAQSEISAATTVAKPSVANNQVIVIDDFDDDDDSGNWLQPMTLESAISSMPVQVEDTNQKSTIPGTSAPIAEDPRQMSLFD